MIFSKSPQNWCKITKRWRRKCALEVCLSWGGCAVVLAGRTKIRNFAE